MSSPSFPSLLAYLRSLVTVSQGVVSVPLAGLVGLEYPLPAA